MQLHNHPTLHESKLKKFIILPHNSVFPDLATCGFFLQILKRLYVILFASPNKPLIQISVSDSEIYLNQHTVTYFKNGFRDLNYVFQTPVNTLKRCNVLSRMLLRCKQALRICQHSNMHVFTYSMHDGEGDMKKCLLEKIFFSSIASHEVNLIFCKE